MWSFVLQLLIFTSVDSLSGGLAMFPVNSKLLGCFSMKSLSASNDVVGPADNSVLEPCLTPCEFNQINHFAVQKIIEKNTSHFQFYCLCGIRPESYLQRLSRSECHCCTNESNCHELCGGTESFSLYILYDGDSTTEVNSDFDSTPGAVAEESDSEFTITTANNSNIHLPTLEIDESFKNNKPDELEHKIKSDKQQQYVDKQFKTSLKERSDDPDLISTPTIISTDFNLTYPDLLQENGTLTEDYDELTLDLPQAVTEEENSATFTTNQEDIVIEGFPNSQKENANSNRTEDNNNSSLTKYNNDYDRNYLSSMTEGFYGNVNTLQDGEIMTEFVVGFYDRTTEADSFNSSTIIQEVNGRTVSITSQQEDTSSIQKKILTENGEDNLSNSYIEFENYATEENESNIIQTTSSILQENEDSNSTEFTKDQSEPVAAQLYMISASGVVLAVTLFGGILAYMKYKSGSYRLPTNTPS